MSVIAEEIRDIRQELDPIPSVFDDLLNPIPLLQDLSISTNVTSTMTAVESFQPELSTSSSNPDMSFTSVTESCSINSEDEPLSSLMPPDNVQPPTPIQKRRKRNQSD